MLVNTVATDEVWLTLSRNINSRNERYCCSEQHSAGHAVSLPNKDTAVLNNTPQVMLFIA
jgi:hypothetical protein